MARPQYRVSLEWSQEDNAYVATWTYGGQEVSAVGSTPAIALREVANAVELTYIVLAEET